MDIMKNNTFQGISEEALWLLKENMFRDSKAFYEENKAKINALAVFPTRRLAELLSNDLLKIDPAMNLIPQKIVSRVRRDTRLSKDKNFYRDHMWVTFGRNKADWPFHPCLWFEFSPENYSYGVGFRYTPPAMMEVYRKHLLNYEEDFLAALKSLSKTKAKVSGEEYKKSKANHPETLSPFFNRKYLCFIAENPDITRIADNRIVSELRAAYKKFAPMYEFMAGVSDEYVSTLAEDSH